jgi:hypothetical protein
MRFCPTCGSAIRFADARFCDHCGLDLSAVAPNVSIGVSPASAPAAQAAWSLTAAAPAAGGAPPAFAPPTAGTKPPQVSDMLAEMPTPLLVAAGSAVVALFACFLPWASALGITSTSGVKGVWPLIPPIVALVISYMLRASMPASLTPGRINALRITFGVGMVLAVIVFAYFGQTVNTGYYSYRVSDLVKPEIGLLLYLVALVCGLVAAFKVPNASQFVPTNHAENTVGSSLKGASPSAKRSCPHCGASVWASLRVCPECRGELSPEWREAKAGASAPVGPPVFGKRLCPYCGASVWASVSVCQQCGREIADA